MNFHISWQKNLVLFSFQKFLIGECILTPIWYTHWPKKHVLYKQSVCNNVKYRFPTEKSYRSQKSVKTAEIGKIKIQVSIKVVYELSKKKFWSLNSNVDSSRLECYIIYNIYPWAKDLDYWKILNTKIEYLCINEVQCIKNRLHANSNFEKKNCFLEWNYFFRFLQGF